MEHRWRGMNEIWIGSTLGILILMQLLIIRERINMKLNLGTSSNDLQTELGNLGSLLDEAIDFLVAGAQAPSPVIAQAGGDLKEVLLASLMNKMLMPSEHGNPQESQERQVYENQPENIEEEIV